MNEIQIKEYNLNKDNYVIVGVSGGSDSMSLLDTLFNNNYKIVCAHVNYHHRDSANRDENIVKEYCKNHKIIFEKANFNELNNKTNNFQDVARDFRYNFFSKLYKEYNASALFIAHQLDDCVETYLFKKQRGSVGRHLTIQENDYIYKMNVIRPLLNYRKSYLEQYCVTHSIIFGVDESNLGDNYSRNIIRHNKIEKMNTDEFNSLVKTMNLENDRWEENYQKMIDLIKDNKINLNTFKTIKNQENLLILMHEFINKNCPNEANTINNNKIINLIEKMQNEANYGRNCLIFNFIKDEKSLVIKDKYFEFIEYKKEDFKPIIIKDFNDLNSNKFFTSEDIGIDCGVCVLESDFPLKLKTINLDEYVIIKDEKRKKINRLLIDKKVPIYERNNILGLYNCKNEILLINNLYKNYYRLKLKNNIYMVL